MLNNNNHVLISFVSILSKTYELELPVICKIYCQDLFSQYCRIIYYCDDNSTIYYCKNNNKKKFSFAQPNGQQL